jgi:tRNA dimethylallyltransferase
MQTSYPFRQAIFISGPTASGKTDLAVFLANNLPIDLISVDSTLVYKGLNIGSGKPSCEILQQAPHSLIDIVEPIEVFSVGLFRDMALEKIEAAFNQNRIPCLVGGTMMYFKALSEGLNQAPGRDNAFRQLLLKRAAAEGVEALHKELIGIDHISANKIHPNDYKRIERALEIFYLTGKTKAEHIKAQVIPQDFDIVHIALVPLATPREKLHENIALRFNNMLKQGFIEEVEQLMNRGDLSLNFPSMRSVGYQQIWRYLQGEYPKEEMSEKALIATRQLAKHQLTWLRAWEEVQLFDFALPNLHEVVLHYVENKLGRHGD